MHIAIVLYAGLCLLIWLLFSYTTIKEIIRILSTSKFDNIGGLPTEGQVEVVGKAVDKTIQSPITQSACVLWQIEIQERHPSRNGYYWTTIHKEISKESFEIRDGTGKIQILPDCKSELMLKSDSIRSGKSHEFDSQTQAMLEKLGIKTSNSFGFDTKLQVIERYISTGDDVYVLGQVIYDNGIKTVTSGRGTRLIISDQGEKKVLGKLGQRIAGYGLLVLAIGYIFGGFGVSFLSQFIK